MCMLLCKSYDLSFDKILSCHEAIETLSKEYLVKKMQKKLVNKKENVEKYEEFELQSCPELIIYFFSDKDINVGELDVIDFEVNNLIVLGRT